MARNIVFSVHFDLCADEIGLRVLPSGTTPHNPKQTRFIFRNAELSGKTAICPDLSARVAALAEAHDEDGLLRLLRGELRPVDRAAESRGWI